MKKKFAFFTGPFIVGGLEQVLVNAANILAKQGHSVTIVWSGAIQKNHMYNQLSPDINQIHCCPLFHIELSTQKPKNKLKRKIWKLKYWYLIRSLRNTKNIYPTLPIMTISLILETVFLKFVIFHAQKNKKRLFGFTVRIALFQAKKC